LLLGVGHALRQIANAVGVTENTVRSQIKSVFSKAGVKRQSELIWLLLTIRQTVLRTDSRIYSWGFDEQTQALQVKYWETGKVFDYHDVWPAYVVLVFEDSSAPGREWGKYRARFAASEVKE
jgi:hypothetical protein